MIKQIRSKKELSEEEYEFFKQINHLYNIKELSEIFGITQIKVKKYLLEIGAIKEEVIPKGMKKCVTCGEIFPLENFGKKSTNKDGRTGYCLVCTAIYKKKYKEKKEEEMKEKAKQEYIDSLKGKELFCERCNEKKTIDDYRITAHFRNGRYSISRKCRKCDAKEGRERNMRKIKEQGFY